MTHRTHSWQGDDLLLTDGAGGVKCFKFGSLRVHAKLQAALARAFVGAFGHTMISSQGVAWASVRKFSSWLEKDGLASAVPLPERVLTRYGEYLANSGLAGSTAQRNLNDVGRLLVWCNRNCPEILDARTKLTVPKFKRQQPHHREALSDAELQSIMAACYSEIEAIESRIRRGRQLLSMSPGQANLSIEASLFRAVLVSGQGAPPGRTAHNEKVLQAKRELGGIREIWRRGWLRRRGLAGRTGSSLGRRE